MKKQATKRVSGGIPKLEEKITLPCYCPKCCSTDGWDGPRYVPHTVHFRYVTEEHLEFWCKECDYTISFPPADAQ